MNLLQNDKSRLKMVANYFQKCFKLFLCVRDLHHHGHIFGELSILKVRMTRVFAPKPMMPRTTVAPASSRSRACKTIHSYNGLPLWRSNSPMKMRSKYPSSGKCMFISRSNTKQCDQAKLQANPKSHSRQYSRAHSSFDYHAQD